VAEGVEDEATLQMLVDLGCDGIQGYLTGRPMPAHELPGWLATHAPAPAGPPHHWPVHRTPGRAASGTGANSVQPHN
jgi:predicted signal transduction protein with EAL and GGDEF domain